MKRAANAHRLAFILTALALTSLAIGAPPPHAQGEPPPYSEEDCVFEGGRTICEAVVFGPEQVSEVGEIVGECVDSSGQRVDVYKKTKVLKQWARTVYYGTSHVIESEEIVVLDWIETEKTFAYSWCL